MKKKKIKKKEKKKKRKPVETEASEVKSIETSWE